MSKVKSKFCRRRFLLLLFVFVFISSLGLLLCSQSAESSLGDTKLSYLNVAPGALSPSFNPNTTDYTVNLSPNNTSIDITAQADTGRII
jgi:hypothetical protein